MGWSLPALKVGRSEKLGLISVFLVREGSGYRVEDLDKSSTDGFIAAVQRNPDDIVRAHLSYQQIAGGLYDITTLTDQYELELRPITSRTLTPAELGAARAAFAGWVSSKDGGAMPGAGDAIRQIGPAPWKFHVPGVIHSIAALIGWCLFLYSLGWLGPWYRQNRKRRRANTLREGRCPSCGYEVYGLTGDICPECGKLLNA